MDLSLQIDKVNTINCTQFKEQYFKPQKPVIIKGLAQGSFAESNWSINYFKETMGNCNIDLYDNANKKSAASANTTPDLTMKFSDFLTIISKEEPSTLRIFLFNMFKLNPNLKKEFPCPKIFKGILDDVGHMFFAGKNTTVRIHYDIDMSNVLHTHFGGRKRVVLIPPEYTDLLYRLPLNTYSLVNIDKPDYKNYPGLRLVKGYDFILEPGDSLFMPEGYWHYMTYLETGFSISHRKIASSLHSKLQGFACLCLTMPIDKLINKLVGDKWLDIKKQIAKKRAYRAIEKHYLKMRQTVLLDEIQDMTFV
jgi:hypothetical protein